MRLFKTLLDNEAELGALQKQPVWGPLPTSAVAIVFVHIYLPDVDPSIRVLPGGTGKPREF